jgi:hypothetical protein
MLQPSNSPDLSAIEPPWMWIKRETTKHGAATSKTQMKEDWQNCWDDMSQERIQVWIRRIPIHVQEVIKLEGGNKYKEGISGRKKNQTEYIKSNSFCYRCDLFKFIVRK